MRRRLQLLTAVTFGLLLGGVHAEGDEVHTKLARLCEALRPILEARGGTVAVGSITSSAELEASGGPAIANTLIEEFKRLGIRVNRKAPIEITGRYSKGISPQSGLTSLLIKFKLLDAATTEEIANFDVNALRVDVTDAATIMKLAGGSGDISGGSRREQSEKVRHNLEDPQVHIVAGTRISAGPASPFAIEILVGAGGAARPKAASAIQGKAFLKLRDGEIYAVRLINDTETAVVVSLAIDGLSMFAFSDDPRQKESMVIVAARSQETIRGWYRNPEESNEFLVGALAQAAVARQLPPSPESIGTITATFAVAWPTDAPPPPGEDLDVVKGDSATLLGKKISQKYERVEFNFGKPKVAVSVRYNKNVEPGDLPVR